MLPKLTEKQILKIRKAFNGVDHRQVFSILAEKNRYRIFEMLVTNPQISVGDIAKVLGVSMPLASQHLKMMLQAKILKKTQIGKKVLYELEHANRIAESMH